MKISDIDFPKPLLTAARDDRLVVFAGAGVSRGEPARLPSFRALAQKIARGTTLKIGENEPEDHFLGKLQHAGVDVHELARIELSESKPQPTDLHRNLVRLYREAQSVRIVTTNFDTLFELAAHRVFEERPRIFCAPALPLGREFTGIVHVHGVTNAPTEMVLTDADFGRAYLTEGWARRFLVDLFNSFTILFVGYSHNDTIMKYLARALPTRETEARFALTHDSRNTRWKFLGIEPVFYRKDAVEGHRSLHNGISYLAKYIGRGILDWKREISEVARHSPSLGEEERDFIDEILADVARTRFFTESALSPDWIVRLDQLGHLDGLFDSRDFKEYHTELARWLAINFASQHADGVFRLILKRDMQLNPVFWFELGRVIGLETDSTLDDETFSQWVSLLVDTAPANPDEHVLLWLGKSCVERELTDCLIEVFEKLTTARLRLSAAAALDELDDEHSRLRIQLSTIGSYEWINELWISGLQPNLASITEQLLGSAVRNLAKRHQSLRSWRQADDDWDPDSFDRLTIEPYLMDDPPEPIDVVVDVARDSLEMLAVNEPESAAQWSNRLSATNVPLLRRLAVHVTLVRKDLQPNEKIDWFLAHTDLHYLPSHHELFRLVRETYPYANTKHRQAVIKAVLDFRWSDDNEGDQERLIARHHFDWLHWIHSATPDCALAAKALEDVLKKYPYFEPQEHPDLTHWSDGGNWHIPQSPWTVEELLSRPLNNKSLQELLSFQGIRFRGPDREGLLLSVGAAAQTNITWGLALADTLANDGNWNTDLWIPLLRTWSDSRLKMSQFKRVLKRLNDTRLQARHVHAVSKFLSESIQQKHRRKSKSSLATSNAIAGSLWNKLPVSSHAISSHEWATESLNHPAGYLAQYWLFSLSKHRNLTGQISEGLDCEYRKELSKISRDKTLSGRLGRCILAGKISFLVSVDEGWVKTELLPYFNKCQEPDDYLAVWDGFLTWSTINPPVATLLSPSFFSAAEYFPKRFDEEFRIAKKFTRFYTALLAYFIDDPIERWIPKFFDNCSNQNLFYFSSSIGTHLQHMSISKREVLWNRWLRTYWEGRLNGVPKPLVRSEIESMIEWLPFLSECFEDAVGLAIRMPKVSQNHGFVMHKIYKSTLDQVHTAVVARLVIYLGASQPSDYPWHYGRELINRLLERRLPSDLEQSLRELYARLGFT